VEGEPVEPSGHLTDCGLDFVGVRDRKTSAAALYVGRQHGINDHFI
jgi:hypothetical protein